MWWKRLFARKQRAYDLAPVDVPAITAKIVADVQILSPKPGDILLCRTPHMDAQTGNRFREELARAITPTWPDGVHKGHVFLVHIREHDDIRRLTDDDLKQVGLQRREPCCECGHDPDEPPPEIVSAAELAARELANPPLERIRMYEATRWPCPGGCDETLVLLGQQISCPSCETVFTFTPDPQRPLPLVTVDG